MRIVRSSFGHFSRSRVLDARMEYTLQGRYEGVADYLQIAQGQVALTELAIAHALVYDAIDNLCHLISAGGTYCTHSRLTAIG